MKTNKILCPLDFSRSSEAGLEYATQLARSNDALLYLLHVSEVSPIYSEGLGGFADYDEDIRLDSERLKAIIPSDSRVRFEHHHRVGSAASEIIRFSNRYGADLIVMGTHGRTGLSRWVMGSVAENVIRKSRVPVLAVHYGQPIPEDESTDVSSTLESTPITCAEPIP